MESNSVASADSNVVLIVLIVSFIMILFSIIFFAIPAVINNYILFNKARKNKWAALVPIYNVYVLGVISKKPLWIVWLYIAFSILPSLINYGLPLTWEGYSIGYYYIMLPFIWLSFGIYIYILISFAKQYKTKNIKDILYWLLYLFLPIVAVFWTNKIEYIGNSPLGKVIENNVYKHFNSNNATVESIDNTKELSDN